MAANSLLTPTLPVAVIGWRNWLVDRQLPFHSVSLFLSCAAGCWPPVTTPLVCAPDWPALISFNFLSAPSTPTSASVLVEWRRKDLREKKTLVTKCYSKTFSCSGKTNKQTNKTNKQTNNCNQALITYSEIRRSECTLRTCGSGSRSFGTPSLHEFSYCS